MLALAFAVAATAADLPRVALVGLFPGKAVLEIEGERYVLAEGERSPEGITLIQAGEGSAVISHEGRRHEVALSRAVGGRYAEPERRTVRIARDGRGMYSASGSINGRGASFLVDTGATLVAVNRNDARRFGIDFEREGTRVMAETASGQTAAWRVRLDRVRVGEIELRDVPALVVDGGSPRTPLLGMSFLGRLSLREEGGLLLLEQR
ncbi:retropepsin-like aspartic protease family protein [Spiribacter halobius]|uniref:retropepsin-like aspartic protease family protein n=1 Tax=Sediminicurvatus halobius TaxID=2182432 RepID=UPI001E4D8C7C|nr:TIGR02281 family clan AA aspartic protease [Spiribacter halobius]UEX78959.1 TIGR02281 family clan AA aspartic protease [Spiribacter halobius]